MGWICVVGCELGDLFVWYGGRNWDVGVGEIVVCVLVVVDKFCGLVDVCWIGLWWIGVLVLKIGGLCGLELGCYEGVKCWVVRYVDFKF